MNWLPIESAPKDGTKFLCLVKDGNGSWTFDIVYWRTEDYDDEFAGVWSSLYANAVNNEYGSWRDGLSGVDYTPHSWMPLPDFPNKEFRSKL